jgi:hypothetical protein
VRFPSLAIGPLLQPTPLPDGGAELSVLPDGFHNVFCADLPDADAAFMAHAQRPLLATAFEEPATAAAWRLKPSWAVFGTADQPIAPHLHRFSCAGPGRYSRPSTSATVIVPGPRSTLSIASPAPTSPSWAGGGRRAAPASAARPCGCRGDRS